MNSDQVKAELRKLGSEEKAKSSSWFFKTGKGEYGEGDLFLGLTVPQQRVVAQKYIGLPLSQIETLLQSKFHEDRFTALAILVLQYKKSSPGDKKKIFKFYLKNKERINNWDLVDCSVSYIVGEYVFENPLEVDLILKLAKSPSLWDRRIAIVSTMYSIHKQKFAETLQLCEILLNDREDLIHKACGWMLREVYKQDSKVAVDFLNRYSSKMPRTMLRYAIERMPEKQRKEYLQTKLEQGV